MFVLLQGVCTTQQKNQTEQMPLSLQYPVVRLIKKIPLEYIKTNNKN